MGIPSQALLKIQKGRVQRLDGRCVLNVAMLLLVNTEMLLEQKYFLYCSTKCRNAARTLKWRIKKGLIKSPGVGSGGNQWGANNHQYTGKSGVGGCMRAMRELPNICNRCASTKHLVAHHIDHDRTNNELSNFEILCKKCHQAHHTKRDSQGKYTKVQSTP